MTMWITADQVFDGTTLLSDHGVQIGNGRITALRPKSEIAQDKIDHHHRGTLTPGFFDIQVNGGGGVLLNNDPTPNGIATIAAAHRGFGTTALLPTVITDAPGVLERAVAAILQCREIPGVKGLHIEGPHIALAKRGTHAAAHVRPMDNHTLGLVRQLRDAGLAVLITVAPEAATDQHIQALCDMGAVVSLGHSNASAEAVRARLAAGARGFTHLYNAMSPMESRAPGMTGTAIASEAWCSIIADGHHVDPAMIMLAMRARPVPHRMIAVSDAMATVGGPDAFNLYEQIIRLVDGMLINDEGALAGAHLTLIEALQNLIRFGTSPEVALQMCHHNPLAFMGLEAEIPLCGSAAENLVALHPDYTLHRVGADILQGHQEQGLT